MNKKQQASLETSKKILAIARKHFSLKGYAEASLEEIVDDKRRSLSSFRE